MQRSSGILLHITSLPSRFGVGDLGPEALAFVEQGVIGKLDECSKEWCRVFIGREKGWVMKTELWGVDAEELRD